MAALPDVEKDALAEVADRYDLDLVLLFGSQAKGTARKGSDTDIAVHTTRPGFGRDPEADAAWEMDLFDALAAAIKAPDGIDLVVLNRAGSTLQFQVARHGTPLYARRAGGVHAFRSYAARRYDDDQKLRQRSWQSTKRRCQIGH